MKQYNFVFLVALATILALSSLALSSPTVEYRLTVTKDGKPVNASISVYTVKNYVQKDSLIATGNVVNGTFKFNYSYPNETFYLLYVINIDGTEYRSYKKYTEDMVKTETITVNVTNADNTTTTQNLTIYYIKDSVKLGTKERVFGWVAARATLVLLGLAVVVVILVGLVGGRKRRGLFATAILPATNLAGLQLGPISVSTSGIVFAGIGGIFALLLILLLVYLMGKKNVFKV